MADLETKEATALLSFIAQRPARPCARDPGRLLSNIVDEVFGE